MPGKPAEIDQLKAQVQTVARVPIIVGDHRLSVEIVTPKTDMTLNAEKYAVIDARITTRLYQMFLVHSGSGGPRSDDSVKLAKVIARGLESRRCSSASCESSSKCWPLSRTVMEADVIDDELQIPTDLR
jgi:hypothetical protein